MKNDINKKNFLNLLKLAFQPLPLKVGEQANPDGYAETQW